MEHWFDRTTKLLAREGVSNAPSPTAQLSAPTRHHWFDDFCVGIAGNKISRRNAFQGIVAGIVTTGTAVSGSGKAGAQPATGTPPLPSPAPTPLPGPFHPRPPIPIPPVQPQATCVRQASASALTTELSLAESGLALSRQRVLHANGLGLDSLTISKGGAQLIQIKSSVNPKTKSGQTTISYGGEFGSHTAVVNTQDGKTLHGSVDNRAFTATIPTTPGNAKRPILQAESVIFADGKPAPQIALAQPLGGAKLADLDGSRRSLIGFGVPEGAARWGAVGFPVAELAIGVALAVTSASWWGAIGALGVLVVFLGGISINMWLGRKPDCHCFGQLHSAPAGWSTLARNGVLASAAGFLVWQGGSNPGPSLVSWFSDLTASGRVALLGGFLGLALLAGQAALLIQILKQQGRILLRLDALDARPAGAGTAVQSQAPVAGLPVGSPAPAFRLSGLDGTFVTLEDLLASARPVLLLSPIPVAARAKRFCRK
jgi:hypothetical protein